VPQSRGPSTKPEEQAIGDPDVFVVAAPIEEDSMPNTPTIERAGHGIPTYTEAQAASLVENITKRQQPDLEQNVTTQAAADETEPEHTMVQESVLDPEIQHADTHTVLEPTKATLVDERHDTEDGETRESLEATDMAGEMR
jgi:hypothetical protein